MRNTTTSTIGGMTLESHAAASRTSNSTALGPPTSVPGAARCAASRIGSIRSKASVEYGGGPSTAWTSTPGVALRHRPAHQLDAVDAPTALPHGLHRAGIGHDDVRRRARARREAAGQDVLALDRLDLRAVAVVRGEVGRVEGEPAAEDEQDQDRADRDARRVPGDPPAHAAPEPVRLVRDPLVPEAAHLVRLEERAVERAEDQRRHEPARQPREQRVQDHERQQEAAPRAHPRGPAGAPRNAIPRRSGAGAARRSRPRAPSSRSSAARTARTRGGRRS